jgi:hypothetical protein
VQMAWLSGGTGIGCDGAGRADIVGASEEARGMRPIGHPNFQYTPWSPERRAAASKAARARAKAVEGQVGKANQGKKPKRRRDPGRSFAELVPKLWQPGSEELKPKIAPKKRGKPAPKFPH